MGGAVYIISTVPWGNSRVVKYLKELSVLGRAVGDVPFHQGSSLGAAGPGRPEGQRRRSGVCALLQEQRGKFSRLAFSEPACIFGEGVARSGNALNLLPPQNVPSVSLRNAR